MNMDSNPDLMGVIINLYNHQLIKLVVGLTNSSNGRALHQHRRGQGFESPFRTFVPLLKFFSMHVKGSSVAAANSRAQHPGQIFLTGSGFWSGRETGVPGEKPSSQIEID